MPRPKRWKNDAERKRYERAQARADALRKAAEERHPKAAASAPADEDAAVLSPEANALSPVLDAALAAPSANRTVLEAIRDNPGALDSDRIRSVTEIAKLDAAEADKRGDMSPILAWRDVLAALPVGDRLKAWKAALERARGDRAGNLDLDAAEFTYDEGEGS